MIILIMCLLNRICYFVREVIRLIDLNDVM